MTTQAIFWYRLNTPGILTEDEVRDIREYAQGRLKQFADPGKCRITLLLSSESAGSARLDKHIKVTATARERKVT